MKAKHSPESFMREAIKLSAESVQSGGGPFGAVIVRNGEIIARGENRVTVCNDPTAHAEVSAIREAAARMGTYDLSGCEIYSSCEPCPMCLGAIYWARLDRLYYALALTLPMWALTMRIFMRSFPLTLPSANCPRRRCCARRPSGFLRLGLASWTRRNIDEAWSC